MPGARNEAWRYTNLAPLTQQAYRFLTEAERAPGAQAAADFAAARLVFVDGWFSAERSDGHQLPPGVTVTPLGESLVRDATAERTESKLKLSDAFQFLNDAFIGAGARIQIAPGVHCATPLHLEFLQSGASGPSMSHPRVVIECAAEARLDVIEHHAGGSDQQHLSNVVTEIHLAEEARLRYYRVQDEAPQAFHVGRAYVTQRSRSRFEGYFFSSGAALSRHDIDVACLEPKCTCEVAGLYLGYRNQHVDYHLNIDHAGRATCSRAYFKGVLGDRARGVFNGRILVKAGAQGADAQLTNRNLLLSERAEIDTKPELEIYADDVKCSHGASVGRLDQEALFYLRSRGIPLADARAMLIQAFARELTDRVAIVPLRDKLAGMLLGRLPDARSSGAAP
jgi:Fe-S cluster assembly protein SufD